MDAGFSGFQIPVRLDQALGHVFRETDYAAYVAQLIREVLLTAPGERVNRPDFGAGLRRLVFAPSDQSTATLVRTTILQNLERWLGAIVAVDDVATEFSDGTLTVAVTYTIRSTGKTDILDLEVRV
jgi:phage baseplate assembly protein W